MSLKRDIESGNTTVDTAKQVASIIITVTVGALILGFAVARLFF